MINTSTEALLSEIERLKSRVTVVSKSYTELSRTTNREILALKKTISQYEKQVTPMNLSHIKTYMQVESM